MKDDTVYLAHIMEAIEKIERYAAGKTCDDLVSDSLLQDGLARQLQIIGEACKQVSMEIKEDNPGVPWRAIAGMRDVLVHQYCGVIQKDVWDTVKNDIPGLKNAVERILEPAGGFKALREKTAEYAAKKKIKPKDVKEAIKRARRKK